MTPRQQRVRTMQRQVLNAPRMREPLTPDPEPVAVAVVADAAPSCDRSADAGTKHYWPDGASIGDFCLCGKRRRFTPFK